MTLKGVCNTLSRRPQTLDVVMLFTQSVTLLQPLCHMLDNWQEHEDQGEYQPVYDEFGSILLFVVLVKHRFSLQTHDLGVDSPNSFVLKYFKSACTNRSPDELTAHENKLLGGWIRGLFEAEGINNELMSMSSPKEFHLLVATLFDQSLKACQAKFLALDTLRGGFEYLLEPFLLPSLSAGLVWFAHHVWETTERSTDIEITIPALQSLLKPPSMSSDSSAMHAAVLSIVAKPLEDSLGYAQQLHPLRADINPLLEILKPHAQKQRHEVAFHNSLETWASTAGGGLLAAMRHTIQSLLIWSSATPTSGDMTPPQYTHRQLAETVRLLGAKAVLNLLLDETMAHFETGSSPDLDIALDIIVTMISAPQHQFPFSSSSATLGNNDQHLTLKRQLSLRDALNTELSQAFDLSKTNLSRATMIVRLHRRVETLVGRPNQGVNGVVGANADVLMHGVVHNAEGLPTADIDDVLVEADNQLAHEFLAGGGDASVFLGV
ncbi:mediator complex subunit [Pseudocyphellaria aurata]|nr:mediator complex subunit [Pseudocyphellaria aurata]